MRVLAASPGSLPLPEAGATPEGLQWLLAEQSGCDLDLWTDGQIDWPDPVSRLARQLTGVDLTDSGSYCGSELRVARPLIRGPFAWAVPVARPEFERALAVSVRPLKVVLTGALTLARHSVVRDPYYGREFARLVTDYNEALVCEVRELASAGAEIIQIDEPAMLAGSPEAPQPADWRLLKACLRRLASAKGNARLLVNLGWGDPAPLLEEIFSLPADMIGLDLSANPRVAEILAHGQVARPLQLGVVNGWSATVEDAESVAGRLRGLVAAGAAPELLLSAAAGLRGLSGEAARGKLRVLAEARDLLAPRKGLTG